MQVKVLKPTGVLNENDEEVNTKNIPQELMKPCDRKLQLVWTNIIIFLYLHIVAVYGLYIIFTSAKIPTIIQAYIIYQCSGYAVTAGVHRLWSHRSYKANAPLRLILMLFNTTLYENSIIVWARDHRVHHKFSETDANPHNAKRGLFFSHVGWLLCRKHPEVKNKGKSIDLSDLYEDPIVVFQDRYYWILMPVFALVLPTAAPMYFWDETFYNAFCVNIFRYVFSMHVIWLVNSVAHIYGNKPYDRYINPADNWSVSVITLGESWHNYHHTFPWDYKMAELGTYSDSTAAVIRLFAKIGWAFDLKAASSEMIKKRVLRTGDGSHEIWGWGDKDQPKEDNEEATITHKIL